MNRRNMAVDTIGSRNSDPRTSVRKALLAERWENGAAGPARDSATSWCGLRDAPRMSQ